MSLDASPQPAGRGLAHELRLLGTAWQFLTRWPLPARVSAWIGFQPAWLAECVRHFPLVGMVVGAWAALVLAAASQAWPPVVAVILSLIASLWLTGAFHEDGLADTFDALGGTVSRAKALEIMKDSRIGTYGSAALMLALALKASLMHTLAVQSLSLACAALVFGHVVSRGVCVSLIALLPYGGDADHAKAKPLAMQLSGTSLLAAWAQVLLITGLGSAWMVLGLGWQPWLLVQLVALSLGASALAMVMLRRWYHARLGGFTGDALGAAQQLSELLVWLVVSAALQRSGMA